MASQEEFDLQDLCRSVDVTVRTVRYYVQQGLLPSPGQGSRPRYHRGHLDRLRLIKQLQRHHWPLAEIRRGLETLDDPSVASLIEPLDAGEPDASSPSAPREPAPGRGGVSRSAWLASPSPTPEAATWRDAGLSDHDRSVPRRSQWERIVVAPDVELHVRRPLSREEGRRVERLLEAAQAIFDGRP